MYIMICGASGMIGSALFEALNAHHNLTVVGRDKSILEKRFQGVGCYSWQELTLDLLASQDAVINLSGENIGSKRWSEKQKKRILNSRIHATHTLASLCALLGKNAPRLLNASAIGVYGLPESLAAQKKRVFDGSSTLPLKPSDFLSEVGVQWESALNIAEDAGISVVKLRFGVVLSAQGGALKKMLPSFRLGLGAKIGSGEQPFSWVALDDVVLAIEFLLNHPAEEGVFNIVADGVVTQLQFAEKLAAHLRKPCFMSLPRVLIKLLFGQMGEELLLSGQSVRAVRLQALGFAFSCPTLDAAFNQLL